MIFISSIPFVAAISAWILAFVSLLRQKRSIATWCFFAGMTVLGIDSLVSGLTLDVSQSPDAVRGLTLALIVHSFVPAPWIVFSLTYSRGDYGEFLARYRIPAIVVALMPVGLSIGFHQQLLEVLPAGPAGEAWQFGFGAMAKVLSGMLLIAHIWILMNLEQTFRSAIGTMRWRIKFVILGLAVIFGARVYVRSQALLFSTYDIHWSGVESSALLIGCMFLVFAYARAGFTDIEVYPSRAVLRSSVTGLLAGGYLFIVGVLANLVRRLGGVESFQIQAFVVLLGMSGLAVVLLSDRLRQRTHVFIGRHFARAQHDSVRIWTEFSRRLANVKDQAGLCAASARLIAETFEVLSVTIWLMDEQKDQFLIGASTAPQAEHGAESGATVASNVVVGGLRLRPAPFDLEGVDEPWAEELRQLNTTTFPNGGRRWCVPLHAGEQSLGALVLADRVNGADYTAEELHLLQCIADQVTSVLVNLRLAGEVTRSRELEAFRTMSAFFVHDLKNAAASLNLTLRNAQVHFDDPAFRQDALRGIANTARRIDDMIGRLTLLRQRPRLNAVESDLNQLVSEVLGALDEMPHVEVMKELQPVPRIMADREQVQSVVTNLVLNARDALGPGGHIRVRTEQDGAKVVLTVADNGCGMSESFVKDSLFRPFQSTKKKGLGIGMFQSRMVVEAHGGTIRVESETGKGSTFRVSLPVQDGNYEHQATDRR